MLEKLCCPHGEDSSGDEVEDVDAVHLSPIAIAAYEVLRHKHNWYHHRLWNVTSGRIVGKLHQTPNTRWESVDDPPAGNDDWFPRKIGEIIGRTRVWCDILTLGPPDGLFMEEIQKAIRGLVTRSMDEHRTLDTPIIVRIMFGNIIGMPVNCEAVIRELTGDIPPEGANHIRLWVGAWRKGVSWNHAKIIAVDGHYLHTGGHNLWDKHYLRQNPVHDLSLELEGPVAHDGHLFANEHWTFVENKQNTYCGGIADRLPDDMLMIWKNRVTISEFPRGVASIFAPLYTKRAVPRRPKQRTLEKGFVPIITMGRYGTLLFKARPSDDAFLKMIDAAQTVVRLALQDLGPICLPGTKITVPGCVWPKKYLAALARVIWNKNVHVKIALSHPGSIPGYLSATEANYGNGWSCVDVAAEIIKSIKKQFPSAADQELRQKISNNLCVCFIREKCGGTWKDGTTMGMHAKHFIIDDTVIYIGSQNLYICDLAEWGVLIDSPTQTKKLMEEYWNPMWQHSYTQEDCDVQAVMDGLEIDRDGDKPLYVTQKTMQTAASMQTIRPGTHKYYDDKV